MTFFPHDRIDELLRGIEEPKRNPPFMDPDWDYDGPSQIPLSKDILVRRNDNPHELLIAVCRKCRERRDDQRIKLHLDGWTIAVESRIEDHDGFILCPVCSMGSYVWEDLY